MTGMEAFTFGRVFYSGGVNVLRPTLVTSETLLFTKSAIVFKSRHPFALPRRQNVQGQGGVAGAQNAATISAVVVAQVQFLATLSLVSNTGTEDSRLRDLAKSVR